MSRRRGRVGSAWRLRSVAVIVGVIGLAIAPAAQVSSLRVLSSNGVKAALERLRAESERAAGRPLAIEFGTSASTRQRVLAGERFDVAMLTADVLDELATAGKVVRGSTAALGRSGIGIGVRSGTAKPDVTTADAIKHVFLAERSVTYASDGASRAVIERMFGTLGIIDSMKPKTILEQGSTRAAARVVNGDAGMILTLVSEIVPVPGLELVGPLPAEFQSYVSFAAGVGTGAADADAGRKLIAFLAGASASPAFTATGIERR